jgi:hypothetical protein
MIQEKQATRLRNFKFKYLMIRNDLKVIVGRFLPVKVTTASSFVLFFTGVWQNAREGEVNKTKPGEVQISYSLSFL